MDRWHEVQELFHAALQQPAETRAAFISEACGANEELRREIESLVAAHAESDSFMEQPALAAMSEVVLNATSSLKPGEKLGAYRIVELIGRGGMGEVYRAHDSRLKRDVAIKVLPTALARDPERLKRFEQEAWAAAALNHPNIISVYDIGVAELSPYIVSELLEGSTLREMLVRGPISLPQALNFATQAARGLAAAHDVGIVHRDLKPENIFLTRDDRLKILDFGLAKLTRVDETVSTGDVPLETEVGKIFGTVGYMSPEQVRGQRVDSRSDIFSFGAILYEMVSGRKAFPGDSPADVISAILQREPAELGDIDSKIYGPLDRTIRHALEKNQLNRFQSARDLAFELEGLASKQPSWRRSNRLQTFARRVTSRGTGKIVVVVALVCAALVSVGLYLRHRHSTTLASSEPIVLADFVNTTSDSVFDFSLKTALLTVLQQSPFLNVLSDAKVEQQLRFMGRPAGERLTLDVTREVCQRASAKALLLGSVSGVGSDYLVSLNAIDCRSGESLGVEQAEAARREQVLEALDKVAIKIRKKLGESLPSLEKYDVPVAAATTSSLEALKAYTLAGKAAKTQGEEAAAPLFKRAIALDRNFAAAHAELALSYFLLNQFDASTESARRAYELRSRVTEHEKLRIDSVYYQFGLGDLEQTAEVFESWKQTYPQEVSPLGNLGVVQSFLGNYDKAAINFHAALQRDPSADNYFDLALTYINLNRIGEAKSVLEDAQSHGFKSVQITDLHYNLGFLEGRNEELEQLLTAAAGDPQLQAELFSKHSDTLAFHGRLQQAGELSRKAIESALRGGDREMAAIWTASAALRGIEYGYRAEAADQAEKALTLVSGRMERPVVAQVLARAGSASTAGLMARDLQKQFPADTLINQFWIPSIQASIELGRRHPERAAEILQKALRYELGNPPPGTGLLYPIYLRGEAYLMLRNGERAAAEFRKIIDHPGIVVNSPLGALAHLQLGRAYALSADKDAARTKYQDFFALWKDADPEIPILKDARREYAKLN